MSDASTISFDLATTNSDCKIVVSVYIDNVCVFETNHLKELYHFSHNISDDDGDHELCVVMANKTEAHTKIDEFGNILKDVLISISNIEIDGVDVNQVFLDNAVYTHDFNGTQPEIKDSFNEFMGCNGTVSLKFSTPLYLWLLENM